MKNLKKLIKGHKVLCFLDFEGTQFTHEMIAVGAVLATIDGKNHIKKMKEPFKLLVKSKNKIGNIVVKLTGITDQDIKEKGVSFRVALEELKKYCGRHFEKCSFVTFGNHDLKILTSSISYNMDYPKLITSQIQKNYFDFTILLNEFVKDDKGNALSLINACKLLECDIKGDAHNPAFDAYNLAQLYDALLKRKDILLDQYISVLTKFTPLPEPIKNTLSKLLKEDHIKFEDFKDYCKNYIND